MRFTRKLALVGLLGLCCVLWTALTPQQIAVNSAVFGSYSDYQLETANVYLLASLAGITINAANILSNSAPFQAYSDRQLQEAQTYLLSQIGGVGGAGLPGTNTIIAYGSAQQTNNASETPAGFVETNSAGGSVTLSNGTIVASGPANVNGAWTLLDSSGALEATSTNGGIFLKNSIRTAAGNAAALISSNVTTSPYLWTSTFPYNVVVYVSQGTNNGIAQNGTGIGFFTNVCTTLLCQPNDFVWVTNNGGRPNFLIKPF